VDSCKDRTAPIEKMGKHLLPCKHCLSTQHTANTAPHRSHTYTLHPQQLVFEVRQRVRIRF